jgi:hypothetical protein
MTVRTRRRLARTCIVLSAAALVALAVFPSLRHHALAGGWGIAASEAVSIVGCAACLHSTRSRS